MRRLFVFILIGSMFFVGNVPVFAANKTWSDSGANDNWSTPDNWDAVPVVNDSLIFAGVTAGPVNDFAADTNFNGIIFAGPGAFTLTGNRITLGGDVVNSSSNTQTIDLNMILSDTRTFNAGTTGNLSIGGILSGSGGLTKTDSNTLTLSGANTYTGTTTIAAGKLILGASDRLVSTGNITLAAGSTLDLNDYNQTIAVLIGDAGSTVSLGSGTLTINETTSTSVFGGDITETGKLDKRGSGTLQLVNITSANLDVTAGRRSILDT
jgi:autotransporter-associated beta strand protein